MKITNIFTTFILVAFIIFPCHAMESALTDPSNSLPLMIQTPFPKEQGVFSAALNPVKPEIAIAGTNIISLVNINTPDKPDTLTIDNTNCLIQYLEYNPQGTLLANNTSYSICIWDLGKKTITHTIDKQAYAFKFNLEGNKLVMRTDNADIQNIIIWDLTTDTKTTTDLNGQEYSYIYLSRTLNGNTFVYSNPDGTIVWNLNDPSKAKKINLTPENITIFGDNENQLASYGPFTQNMLFMYDQKTTSTQIDKGLISDLAYCQRKRKYFFTTTNLNFEFFSVNMLDPNTLEIKELCNFHSNDSVVFLSPTFSKDGSKLLAFGGYNQAQGMLQFEYIDLIDEYTKLLHASSPQSSSNYCTIS